MRNDFYVYIYLNPLKKGNYNFNKLKFDNEPFYVGKGHGDRYLFHLYKSNNNNKHKFNTINKIKRNNKKPTIIKLYENITEYSAFRLEKEIIKLIGRCDLGLGTLTNLTDGGEGGSGKKYTRKERMNMTKIKDKIVQYNNYGEIIKIWDNIVELTINNQHLLSNYIHRACRSNGGRKVDGYFWKYYENENLSDKITIVDKHRPINQYDLNGNRIKKWGQSNEISNLGYSRDAILKCCRNNSKNELYYKFKNYMWFFYDNESNDKIDPYSNKMAKGNHIKNKKEINMFSLDGKFIKTTNTTDLKNENYLTKTIYRCCKGELKTTQGYIWKWK